MLVTLAVKSLAKLERLLPCSKLDLHCPTGAVDCGELVYIPQIGQHQVPAVTDETFCTGVLATIPCFLARCDSPRCSDFRGRTNDDETTFLASPCGDGIEIDDAATETFEIFLQAVPIHEHDTGGQRQEGEPPSATRFDDSELTEAEVAHVP